MALPSLVSTIPPIGSKSIFSMDLGPRVVRTISLTALAAAMLAFWAVCPYSRLALELRIIIGA